MASKFTSFFIGILCLLLAGMSPVQASASDQTPTSVISRGLRTGASTVADTFPGMRACAGCFVGETEVLAHDGLRRIDTLQLCQRVVTAHADQPQITDTVVDPDNWRQVDVEMIFAGTRYHISMLRSLDWVDDLEAGSTIPIEIGELGIEGNGTVTAIKPCPEIEEGEGRLVRMTIRHKHNDTLKLTLSSGEEIVTTGQPPFRGLSTQSPAYFLLQNHVPSRASTRRCVASPASARLATSFFTTKIHCDICLKALAPEQADFVPASELKAGNLVATRQLSDRAQAHDPASWDAELENSGLLKIESIEVLEGQEVFNIEVEGEHWYFVGEDGVWVHNSCASRRSILKKRRLIRSQGFQEHHILSDKNTLIKKHPLIAAAGFNLQGRNNKIFLPKEASGHLTRSIHNGRHTLSHNQRLAGYLDAVYEHGMNNGFTRQQFDSALRSIISNERGLLKSGAIALNSIHRSFSNIF